MTTMIRPVAPGRAELTQLAEMAVAAMRAVENGQRPRCPRSRSDQAAHDQLVMAAGAVDAAATAATVNIHAACSAAWDRQQAAAVLGLSPGDLADSAAERVSAGASAPVIESVVADWIAGKRPVTAWRTSALRADQQAARALGDASGLGESGVRRALRVASGTGSRADVAWVERRAAAAGIATGDLPAAAAEALLGLGRPVAGDPADALAAVADPAADPAEMVERKVEAAAAAAAVARLGEMSSLPTELRRALALALAAYRQGVEPPASVVVALRSGLGSLPEARAVAAETLAMAS